MRVNALKLATARLVMCGCSANGTVSSPDGQVARTTPIVPNPIQTPASSQISGNDWPTFHRASQRTGNNPQQMTITKQNVSTLKLKWKQTTAGMQSNPIVVGNVVYASDNGGRLHAWDEATGTARWTFQGDNVAGAFVGTPHYDNGTLYVGDRGLPTASGVLYAVDASSGMAKWRYRIPEPNRALTGSPLVLDGSVYEGEAAYNEDTGHCDTDNQLLAVSAATGVPRASLSIQPFGVNGADIWSAPVLGQDGHVYVTTGNNCGSAVASTYFSALARLGNLPLQSLSIDASVSSGPGSADLDVGATATAVNGLIVFGSKNGTVYAVDTNTDTVRWQVALGAPPAGILGTIASDGLRLYVPVDTTGTCNIGDVCGAIVALDFAGNVLWKVPTHLDENEHAEFSSPAVSQGVVYAAYDKGISALDATSGAVLWRYTTAFSIKGSPTIVNGGPFIGDQTGGNFYCFTPSGS